MTEIISDNQVTKNAPTGGLGPLMSFSKFSVLYTSETKRPASVFSTLASLFLVRPFIALSHFLLLSPVYSFNSFRSTGEFFFRRFINNFSSSVNSTAFFSGFICGKDEIMDGYIACSD